MAEANFADKTIWTGDNLDILRGLNSGLRRNDGRGGGSEQDIAIWTNAWAGGDSSCSLTC